MDLDGIAQDPGWHHLPLTGNRGVAHFRMGTETPVGDRMLFGDVVARFDGVDGEPDLTLRIVIEHGAPVVADFRLSRSVAGARGTEPQDLQLLGRSSNLDDLVEIALGAFYLKLDPNDGSVAGIMLTTRDLVDFGHNLESARRRRTDEVRWEEVAAIYKANISYKPVKAVERELGISYSWAGALVGQARKAGLLPPTTRGKARG